MTKEPNQSESNKFIVSLEGRPVLFAKEIKITKSKSPNNEDIDEQYKPWPTSFSLEASIEDTKIDSRCVRRLFGLYRAKRGSSHPHRNKLHRIDRYLVKAGKMNGLKRKYTLADIKLYNNNRLPF